MSEFFSQLFTDLNTFDSLMVLFFLLGSFLIGLFTGRSLGNKKLKEALKIGKQHQSDLISIRGERDTLLKRVNKQEEELESTTNLFAKAKTQLTQTQADRDRYQSEWQNNQEQINTLEQDNQAYQSQISTLETRLRETQETQENLHAQVQDLELGYHQMEAEKNQLLTEKEALVNRVEEEMASQDTSTAEEEALTNSRISMIENRVERLTSENDRLRETILGFSQAKEETPGQNLVDMDSINQRLAQLEAENQQLKLNVAALQDAEVEVDLDLEEEIEVIGEIEEIEIDLEAEELIEEDRVEDYSLMSTREKSEIAKGELKKVFGHKIPLATAAEKDKLQLINGIGPFIEEQLNSVGIFTFEQISSFDLEIMNLVTEAIQFFPGRIKRDDWKGQAMQQLVKMA